MNVQTLKSYCLIKGISQSTLAQKAGISRQAISAWIKKADASAGDVDVNIYSKNQERIANVLGVSANDLSERLPVLSDVKQKQQHETTLLWDHLYDSLEGFVAGFLRGQPEALARLVQIYGLFAAEKIAGKQVWDKFPRYKNKIHPAVCRKAEVIWNQYKNRI